MIEFELITLAEILMDAEPVYVVEPDVATVEETLAYLGVS